MVTLANSYAVPQQNFVVSQSQAMLTSYKYPPGEQRKKEKKLALQLHTLHLVTIVIKLSMQDNYLKRVYHSMMLYGVRSLTKRRGREEETIALMALPLVRIQIINEIRITTVNLLIFFVTASASLVKAVFKRK